MNYNEVFEEYNRYVVKLMDAINELVENLRNQKEGEAISKLTPILEGLKWCTDVIVLVDNNFFKTDVNVDRVTNLFNELLDSIENEDYVLLSDILEYEVLPLLDEFQQKYALELLKLGN